MKKKEFYSHLIENESLDHALSQLTISLEEKKELLDLAHATIHKEVLHVVLSHLPEEEKIVFLSYVSYEDHDKLWEHLKSHIDEIEKKIQRVTLLVMNELHKDISQIKHKKE